MLTPPGFRKMDKNGTKLGFEYSKQVEDCVFEYNG
jgi:hypothetical protein